MSYYTGEIAQLFNNSNLNNQFLSFWDNENNFISTSSLDPSIASNLENIAVMQGQITTMQANITALQNYNNNLIQLIQVLKNSVSLKNSDGSNFDFDNLLTQ